MNGKTMRALARAGWKVGTATELLKLTPGEAALVELRLGLVDGVRALRAKQRITQTALAHRLGSSQSRVAKIEAGDPTVSLDLLLRTLFTLGATKKQIARLIAT
jgi:DNA-binding XRE family transcriptional regulator